jgi:4-azaleucine resistance transporter AzlC
MSVVVFAGSAQFVAVQLLGSGAPGLVVVLTTLVINLRHILYSASLAPYLAPLGRVWRWWLAYLLVDETYALAIARYGREAGASTLSTGLHWYVLGVGSAVCATWQATTAIGLFLGALVPESWSLEFTLPLTFIALIVPSLRDRASLVAAVLAGLIAVASAGLPHKVGLIAAAAAGILAGLSLERRS